MDISKINSPWVLMEIEDVTYGISCDFVLSLTQVPKITPLPSQSPAARGIIDFRTKSVQLYDSRLLLMGKSIAQEIKEFEEMLEQRFKDHINWIETLETCIRDDEEFTLNTDPYKCAFGDWYYNSEHKSNNIMFLSAFSRIDEPHKEVHKLGVNALNFAKTGKKEEALNLVKSIKANELPHMKNLFNELKDAYKDGMKETVIVMGYGENLMAMAVDQIKAIEHLHDFDEQTIEESFENLEYLMGVAKRPNGEMVLLLHAEYIIDKYH